MKWSVIIFVALHALKLFFHVHSMPDELLCFLTKDADA